MRRRANTPAHPALTFNEYQAAASQTDLTGSDREDSILVSVLGIAGESGDLATLFKKRLRDGDSYTFYPEECAEELGDILWYLSNLSTKLEYKLEDIARRNLSKTKSRWGAFKKGDERRPLLDAGYKKEEQIPRLFTIKFEEIKKDGRHVVTLSMNGQQCGDALTDNAHFEDGYRYHDVFHLAYAGVLGWSPITRKILSRKRRSVKKVDEIEDGGRAGVIEEGIAAVVFQYAEQHNMLDEIGRIDSDLLSLITRLTSGLEISQASAGEWEQAILQGYKIFRLLNRHRGGLVTVNLEERSLTFQKTPRSN
jgi:NTP pyrophosphatase (non-canonical NTP hydrolase)